MAVLLTPAKPNARFIKRRISGACVRLWLWLWTLGCYLLLEPKDAHGRFINAGQAQCPLYEASDFRRLRSAVALALDLFLGSVSGSGPGSTLALSVALAPRGFTMSSPFLFFCFSMAATFGSGRRAADKPLMRDHMKLLEAKDARVWLANGRFINAGQAQRPLYQASDFRGLRSAVALALDLFLGSVSGSG